MTESFEVWVLDWSLFLETKSCRIRSKIKLKLFFIVVFAIQLMFTHTSNQFLSFQTDITFELALNVPAMSPVARDLDELVPGTHSASADLSPLKSDRNIYSKQKKMLRKKLFLTELQHPGSNTFLYKQQQAMLLHFTQQ